MRASCRCSVCGDCTWNERAVGLACSQRNCPGTYLRPEPETRTERRSLPYLDSTDLFHQAVDLGGEGG